MWSQFKPSKSMPVSRVECQMEWLSIGDVTVASFRPVRRAWPCCGSVIDLPGLSWQPPFEFLLLAPDGPAGVIAGIRLILPLVL